MNPDELDPWIPLLRRQFLFADLEEQELRRVAAKLEPLSLPKGALLFQQGDAGDAFYIIASGEVRLLVQRGLKEQVTGFLTRGDSLGEMAILTGEARTFTVRLETTSEFLVLSKADFEELVKEHPNLLLHFSRLVYRRFLEASRAPETEAALVPRVLGVMTALSPDERTLFLLHLSLALLEQSRRKVLLVDLSGHAGRVAEAMGLKPVELTEESLAGASLRSPDLLRRICSTHPSGLEILSVKPAVLGGRLLRQLFLLTNLLRENYDLVVAALDRETEEVEKAVLHEADRWLVVGRLDASSDAEVVQVRLRTLPSPRAVEMLWLAPDKPPEPGDLSAPHQRVHWPDALAQEFTRTRDPYECLAKHPRSRADIERFARRLGRLQVGLAMGSGAALGYALIGVLKVLSRENVPIDMVVGTSMGAVVGALFAAGMPVEAIEKEALRIDKATVYETLFWDIAVPRSGLLSGTSLLRYFRSHLGYREFKDLGLPFACTATDIETGEEVVLSKGRVAEAVRASMSIPLLFQPMPYGGRYLVDGGLLQPVPTRVLSKMGADILVSVNLTLPAGERRALRARMPLPERLSSVLPLGGPNMGDIFFKMFNTMQYQIAQSQVDISHVLIEPELKEFHWTEFHRAGELVDEGEKAAELAISKIRKHLPLFADSCRVQLRTEGLG